MKHQSTSRIMSQLHASTFILFLYNLHIHTKYVLPMEDLQGKWFLASSQWCSHLPWRVHTLLRRCRSPSQLQSERVKTKLNVNNGHQRLARDESSAIKWVVFYDSVIPARGKIRNPFTLRTTYHEESLLLHPWLYQIQYWFYALSWPCPCGPFSMKN